MKTKTNIEEEDIKPTQVPIEEKVDKESCADISVLPPPAQEPNTVEDTSSTEMPVDGTENCVEPAAGPYPQEEVGIKYLKF